jgi:hypothetical protein
MMLCLMGSLAILSLLLVVFIVDISESVGRIKTKVRVFVCSGMQRVRDFSHKLQKNLMLKRW